MTITAPNKILDMTRTHDPIEVASELELFAVFAGDDPDPIGPGETPRYLYRGLGRSGDDPVDLLDPAAVARVVDAAVDKLCGKSEEAAAWCGHLDTLDDDDRLDLLRLIGDLYGLESGMNVMTCDPRVALHFAANDGDGDRLETGTVRRVRLREVHELSGRGHDVRLVQAHGVPASIAARAGAQQPLALPGLDDDARASLVDAGAWQTFRYPAPPAASHREVGRTEARPPLDPMPDALAAIADAGKLTGDGVDAVLAHIADR